MLRLLSHTASHHRLAQCRTLSDGRIISRRAWQQYLRKNPSPQKPPPPPKEEKPWPKSLQMAGYGMAAIFIPYSIAWFLASNGSARALVHSPQLDDVLRHHFGVEELHDTNYYETAVENQQAPFQLDGEPTYRERCQELEIDALNNAKIKVRVRINGADDFVETVVSGKTLAKPDAILDSIGKPQQQEGVVVAVDFENVVGDIDESDQDVLTEDVVALLHDEDTPLTRETNIYSLWHYMSSLQAASKQQQESPQRMNTRDLDITRLEHEIALLRRDLNDVNCTRDRDDMEQELATKTAALRNKRWKRRLGF